MTWLGIHRHSDIKEYKKTNHMITTAKILNALMFLLFCFISYGAYDGYNEWPSLKFFLFGLIYSVVSLKGIDSGRVAINPPRLLSLYVDRRRLELTSRVSKLRKKLEQQK
jgi:hypothetical protein